MGHPPLRVPSLHPRSMRRTAAGAGVALLALWLAACAGGETVAVPPSQPPAPPPVVSAPPPAPQPVPPAGSLELGRSLPDTGPARPAGPPMVALLVPLSGRASGVGLAMRNAAELALFEIADDAFALSVHDTGSTPDGAAAAARKAIDGGARMIIGPLFAAGVSAVAPVARPAGVPVLAFSNDRSVAGDGVWVFGLLPGQQVERVVLYAGARGLSRFGALVPANAYGSTALQALNAAVVRTGGSVVASDSYPTGRGTENGPLVERFARRVGASEEGTPYIDAVLVPDGGAEIRNLAPLMAYYDIDNTKVRYLGSTLWNDPELGREPALAGGWFAAPSPQTRRAFEQRYRSVFGAPPAGLASLAYDAVSLAAVLARQPGGPAFDRQSLTQPSGFAGVDGLFRLMPDGSNQRGLAVLTLTPRGIDIEDPAPTSFEPLLN
ncbi:penicillin-binding protein activator [Thalassobaculum fulvum]|uniref:Penicillin-binding protein activator n=1 Tax=Thalassobaculum fulvum TaxID=1633335 RepID=A0A918XP30_9PROT|nr:penicillin-binding protein activator [Thalassobaculum fulvum]GHD39763.1 penicillin-binding protein activator [Thalassobaculum fulvum]